MHRRALLCVAMARHCAPTCAIARAIVTKPGLILADEPSGNLDGKTGHEVMDLLFTLCKEQEQTLILVTHNQELSKLCDRCLHLREGRLFAHKT